MLPIELDEISAGRPLTSTRGARPMPAGWALGAALALALGLAPAVADACSCMMPKPTAESIRRSADWSDMVFEGRVVRHARYREPRPEGANPLHYDDERAVVFAVVRSWRGDPGRHVTIVTPRRPAGCGLPLPIGSVHLIFADRRRDGMLGTSSCSFNVRRRDAGATRAALDEGAPAHRPAPGCAIAADLRSTWPGLLILLWIRRGGRRRRSPAEPVSVT